LISVGLLALAPIASAERKVATVDKAPKELTVDQILEKHVTALGGAKLLRAGKSFTFTVSGEKMGKKFSKTVVQARPNSMRVDITSDDGTYAKGFDGTVAWMKKGTDAATKMTDAETLSMKQHAEFDEPLLDIAKKGTKVKLVGKTDAGYDLEVTYKSGEVEHHILDATTFLLAKRTFNSKNKDGKDVKTAVRFGDWRNVQGRMVNHSVTWEGDDGKLHTSAVSKVAFDIKVDAKIFAMPK
jgi:hypothetical protein